MSHVLYLPIIYFFTISTAANIIFPATRFVIRKGYNALFPGITADGKDEDGKDELEKISLDLDDEPEFISPTKFDLSTIKSGDNVFIIGKHDNHSVIKKILEMHDSVPINTIV
ncbi:MAG: hypothetical protein EHM20_01460, partial [Alphaproteobacteria bacterium]